MKPVILVVDMLRQTFQGKDTSSIEEYLSIVPRIRNLLKGARKSKIPIIFACDSLLENSLIFKGTRPCSLTGSEGAKVIDELKPRRKDIILPKRRFSAFFKTDFDQTLRTLGIDTVVVAGINTHVSVYATAIDSVANDFYTIVLEDCSASYHKETHQGMINLLKDSILDPLLRVMSLAEFQKEVIKSKRPHKV